MPNDAGATLLPMGRIAGTAVRFALDFPLLPALRQLFAAVALPAMSAVGWSSARSESVGTGPSTARCAAGRR